MFMFCNFPKEIWPGFPDYVRECVSELSRQKNELQIATNEHELSKLICKGHNE